MNIIAITQKGAGKTENEDRIVAGKNIIADGFFRTQDFCGAVAVADGVGGNNAGAMASHFVAGCLAALENVCVEAFSAINEDLLALSASSPSMIRWRQRFRVLHYREKRLAFSA